RITARYADHWNFVGGPPEEFARKRAVLASHCADIGRDPAEITVSAHVRLNPNLDYQRAVDEAAALGAEGLDLAIVYLPPPHDPAVLEPLAEAIRDSGLQGVTWARPSNSSPVAANSASNCAATGRAKLRGRQR